MDGMPSPRSPGPPPPPAPTFVNPWTRLPVAVRWRHQTRAVTEQERRALEELRCAQQQQRRATFAAERPLHRFSQFGDTLSFVNPPSEAGTEDTDATEIAIFDEEAAAQQGQEIRQEPRQEQIDSNELMPHPQVSSEQQQREDEEFLNSLPAIEPPDVPPLSLVDRYNPIPDFTMNKDAAYTYVHMTSSRHADLFEDFCKDKLPADDIYVPPHLAPINPEDEDDVVPDQHAAFGITQATQKHKAPAWKDLDLASLMNRGPGNGPHGGNSSATGGRAGASGTARRRRGGGAAPGSAYKGLPR
ncbi:Apc13p protein-domain-containing protein [Podospora fimiseda]|uniref:Apc13p protein-domain-containing protein n=1 Tax=Podospora fimiseda TaxID=252190 RepID=A0AAN7BVF9_9PEZI|nr:Apc13p protein-domain-containing protein [Podospora fimiseda]